MTADFLRDARPSRPSRCKPFGYWTFDRVAAAAAPFTRRRDFSREQASAYQIAFQKGWLDAVCAHMAPPQRPYTRRDFAKAIASVSTLKEFREQYPNMYTACSRLGWQDILAGLKRHERPKKPWQRKRFAKPAGYWTFERVCETAKRFNTRAEFRRHEGSAHALAERRGWIKAACAHMPQAGTLLARHVYVITSEETQHAYVGLAADPQRRYVMHRSRPARHVADLISKPHTFKVATTEPIAASDAAAMEGRLIEEYRAAGWTVVNISKAGGLGGRHDNRGWISERLAALAKKFETRNALRIAHPGAYHAAHKVGILDAIFANHPNQGYRIQWRHGQWTLDALKAAAANYTTREEFRNGAGGAYQAAYKKGWLNEVFADHPNQGYLPTTSDKRKTYRSK